MEGDGPINGKAKPLGVLVMGSDLVAVDATCCRLMRLDPEQVPHLRAASRTLASLPPFFFVRSAARPVRASMV